MRPVLYLSRQTMEANWWGGSYQDEGTDVIHRDLCISSPILILSENEHTLNASPGSEGTRAMR